VLRTRGAAPEEIRIPIELQEGNRLHTFSTVSVLYPEGGDPDDTEWKDLALIRIEPGKRPFHYVDLDEQPPAPLEQATFDDAIRIFGFPRALDSSIDYTARKIQLQSLGVDGAYWGRTSSTFVHAAIFDTFGKVDDLDGMSGGPAFYARPGSGKYYFAGVVITGGVQAKRIRFIEAAAIIKTLEWHYTRDPNGPRRGRRPFR
jgi:hypothetical protein